ncbi:MAG: twin-arginine translocase subunit TatC [Clostridiales bacterium]|jgi:hypothetical protein|nr:twin-arginine translocase subunit TatC [Clostridiales bacterium]
MPEDKDLTLKEHLAMLHWRLIIILAAFAILFLFSFFSPYLFEALNFDELIQEKIFYRQLLFPLEFKIKLSSFAAVFLTLPLAVPLLGSFFVPALTQGERKHLAFILPVSLILALSGIFFGTSCVFKRLYQMRIFFEAVYLPTFEKIFLAYFLSVAPFAAFGSLYPLATAFSLRSSLTGSQAKPLYRFAFFFGLAFMQDFSASSLIFMFFYIASSCAAIFAARITGKLIRFAGVHLKLICV